MKKIVVVDDEADICFLLKRFLSKNDFIVETAQNGKDGLALIDSISPDLVMTDFRLGDITGTELLTAIKAKRPNVPVLIITGYSDIKVAVSVMKLGAYDYITKPLFPDEILVTVKKAIADAESRENEEFEYTAVASGPSGGSTETTKPARKMSSRTKAGYVMGQSEVSDNLFRQVDLVAPTNFSVIIYGESGSGKEAIAAEIHNRSKRRDMPFVAMDCGAISKELAGSELFGHEKGSFTGALNTKIGHFEMANGGTLFLDEVSNLSYEIQVALLRVVQERKMRRIGGSKEIDLDVRIIVASNERLLESARNGKFREDLYYRFNEFTIEVPALRNRKDDLMLFATTFLDTTNVELNKNVSGFSEDVKNDFLSYSWPGNLRELKNVIKRATLLSDGDLIEEKSLPFEIVNYKKLKDLDEEPVTLAATTSIAAPVMETLDGDDSKPSLKTVANEAEYDMIMQVLRDVNFNKSKAARLLNIDRKTLYNKMKQFDI
ncbi:MULTISPECIES: sigma-54 dependent transcriptional regulator [Dyadobacter]|jgi:two-component system response regulator HydG|uniref:Sigma-54 dependent transcriptional regulator n=1 Tax=Dyadobacter chenhuakuii TaxID=2909339 RepID=A0A9X1TV04_9BACT|nr:MULTISPECIES: sigma-54 dependent transcriptional regulator [Dyadobacter]MCE7071396.1 sigma-54 dependent transcriptional regulator [Dyadobacter sp. CY327]MCF2493717.1 sigma-54 dependent transcriptional regulator [Dyadobacter chenhuakuii]MCF2500770.1 sigma-54 dependent transcriptional regulator [Dyadobacter chenhuakuii]MCF2517966.1 sigma-54 dependent transcriptional regulator [Dyadobacter sp. CY351]USJ30852.1 sigma-54 dependent transcriptional regulator [Dyadobacter chenhuakuii]